MYYMNTSPKVTKDFFEGLRNAGTELHSVIVYKNNECILSISPQPYTTTQKNQIYSLSKSFCSTAVGMACDRGFLSLDEKIIDIFSDKKPEKVSENLSEMTLRHVLSMNSGHKNCLMGKIMSSEDPVKTFLESEVEFKPGTHFTYNTAATFIASAAVTKRTGMSVLDFLNQNLFGELGIEDAMWYAHCEISEGGVGLNISCEDAAKLGLLYLNNGVYNGKRLLSEKYVKDATSFHSDNSINGNPDWCAGYGYQFWVNAREGYRGDGAFGQLCMVFPERNMVVAMLAENTRDMQAEVDEVYKLIESIDAGTEDKSVSKNQINTYIENYYKADKFDMSAIDYTGRIYKLEYNECGYKFASVEKTSDGIALCLSDGEKNQKIKLVSGKWIHNEIYGNYVKPTLNGMTKQGYELYEVYASAYIDKEKKLVITLRGVNCPHRSVYTVSADEEKMTIEKWSLTPHGDNIYRGKAL